MPVFEESSATDNAVPVVSESALMSIPVPVVSIGIVGGLGINVAHELIHKDDKLETWAGGFLLSMVCYAGFKVEHIRGHHVHVSTPEDASSSRYNQTLYQFLPHAYFHNFMNASDGRVTE